MDKILHQGRYFGAETKSCENDLFKLNITQYEPGMLIEKHYHENKYLSVLINGSYHEITNNESYLVRTGNIVFRPDQYIHQNVFHKNGGACFNVEFKNNWHHVLEIKDQLPSRMGLYPTGTYPSLYRLLHYFINCEHEDLLTNALVEWIADVSKPVNMNLSALQWLDKVKKIIADEPAASHTLRSVSERVYVHPVYLASAFKKRTGLTLGEYVIKMKLEKSVTALFTTSLSINEIAVLAGFFDAAHLIRVFKVHYHMTPSKFRQALSSRPKHLFYT